ncbi:MAG: hypothetical protein A2086_16280 [Spirochaetes bacterium GWD1_27_9]|nr:MAG: hypothetical protein A2Z98_10765 [Spirochaetes bacterium GWB1_27_13]OHD24638.1 MAG: hypothetical protein A2Y34_00510 [Spirochaetes bacterium GWC1_27_15]OHD44633.1 MAG: hypothetical protein A2086_16280 [Spirochaetes bacterium GWD1_27_9]
MKKLLFLALLIISISCSYNNVEYEEVIIPQIETSNGGLIKIIDDRSVTYFNKKNSKEKSDIILTSDTYLKQNVNRYLKISGKVIKKTNAQNKNFYNSVIIEARHNSYNEYQKETHDYFFLPLDKEGNFNGYIYFRLKGLYKVYIYKFYDYINYKSNGFVDNGFNTTANIGFYTEVSENVPKDLIFLIPTKNVNCGNKLVRNLATDITKNAKNNLEKTQKIYEFLVFGKDDTNTKFHFPNCKSISRKKLPDYFNTFIASQMLSNKEGVCHDFAELFAALARSAGLKVKKISGYTNETKKVAHLWNLVDLTGDEKNWINIDASWGNMDKKNYKKWAEIYPEFDITYFNNVFGPDNHKSFNYEKVIEY